MPHSFKENFVNDPSHLLPAGLRGPRGLRENPAAKSPPALKGRGGLLLVSGYQLPSFFRRSSGSGRMIVLVRSLAISWKAER